MPITLKIRLPNRTLEDQRADKVILPVQEGTLTIIEGRAPRLQMLTAGEVALLDKDNHVFKRWSISGGLADIASEVCLVATESLEEI